MGKIQKKKQLLKSIINWTPVIGAIFMTYWVFQKFEGKVT